MGRNTIATPNILVDPGFLWAAVVGTPDPTPTVAGSKFTDAIPVAWLPLGPTLEGSTWNFSTSVEPIRVAELFDPVQYATTERSGSIAFNLANFTLSNYQRAINAGIALLTPTSGTGATALTKIEPVEPGGEIRAALLWESTDETVRLLVRKSLQGGEISTAFQKAPDIASIPCTFNMEVPTTGKPFTIWGAGAGRI